MSRRDARSERTEAIGDPVEETPNAEPLPTPDPLAEYPKMLYIGPYRQQVTVHTAEEEAQWIIAHNEQLAPASAATKASASVPGVQVLGAPAQAPASESDSDDDTVHGRASKKR